MGTLSCWAIAVGMVVSGQYFGWNQGFVYANLPTMLVALLLVTVFYVGFMRLLVMLSVAMPASGGVMLYWFKLDRPLLAKCVGVAALCEYFFAVTAIAKATGAYWHGLLPACSAEPMAVLFLILFCALNMVGVQQSLWVEIAATLLALLGLLVFNVSSWHHGEWHHWLHLSLTFSWPALWLAIPYVLWLYLGIEGSVLSAAEVKRPTTTLPRAIRLAMLTLIVTAVMTVFQVASLLPSGLLSSPQPLTAALQQRHLGSELWLHAVSFLALFGLLASLNGLLIAASRQWAAIGSHPVDRGVGMESQWRWQKIFLGLAVTGVLVLCLFPESVLLLLSILAVLCVYLAGIAAWFACARSHRISASIADYGLAMLVSLLAAVASVCVVFSLS